MMNESAMRGTRGNGGNGSNTHAAAAANLPRLGAASLVKKFSIQKQILVKPAGVLEPVDSQTAGTEGVYVDPNFYLLYFWSNDGQVRYQEEGRCRRCQEEGGGDGWEEGQDHPSRRCQEEEERAKKGKRAQTGHKAAAAGGTAKIVLGF
jgi:hypothetical protein